MSNASRPNKSRKRDKPSFRYEQKARKKGFSFVIGVDEAGRGPLAGPVVASAVALKTTKFCARIGDSKSLSPKRREEAFHEIYDNAYVGVGIIAESVIDQVNILEASFLAMRNAVDELVARLPQETTAQKTFVESVLLLVDGNRFRAELPYKFATVTGGDNHVYSICCASIIAKVTRDRILEKYDRIYPQYGFAKHKGYPTADHKKALRRYGYSPIHRKSFNY